MGGRVNMMLGGPVHHGTGVLRNWPGLIVLSLGLLTTPVMAAADVATPSPPTTATPGPMARDAALSSLARLGDRFRLAKRPAGQRKWHSRVKEFVAMYSDLAARPEFLSAVTCQDMRRALGRAEEDCGRRSPHQDSVCLVNPRMIIPPEVDEFLEYRLANRKAPRLAFTIDCGLGHVLVMGHVYQ